MPEKSKLPDFKEITEIATKVFEGIKKSITQAIHDFKEKRGTPSSSKPKSEEPAVTKEATPKKPRKPKKEKDDTDKK